MFALCCSVPDVCEYAGPTSTNENVQLLLYLQRDIKHLVEKLLQKIFRSMARKLSFNFNGGRLLSYFL